MRTETATSDPGSRPIGELVTDAVTQLNELVRQEVDLARAELREDAAAAVVGAAGLGVAGGAALVGAIFVCLGATFGIAEAWPLWVAALVVGGAVLTAAAVAAFLGRRALRAVGRPERTIRTLKEDARSIRHPTS